MNSVMDSKFLQFFRLSPYLLCTRWRTVWLGCTPGRYLVLWQFYRVYFSTGLPWWATIVLSTASLRLLLTLPAHITQQKVLAKRVIMSEDMNRDILPSLQAAMRQHIVINKWSQARAETNYK